MIIRMQDDAGEREAAGVMALLQTRGYEVHSLSGAGPTLIGINGRPIENGLENDVSHLPGVAGLAQPTHGYKLADRASRPAGTVVRVGDVEIGGSKPVIIAGPCVVESLEQIVEAAQAVKDAGAVMLRGGAFKPRTSPYSFQGLGLEGLELLAAAREATGLPIVTEIMDTTQVEAVAEVADVLQIGSRNMMNFPLLKRVAQTDRPVLLKRGFASTIEEWLLSAEYLLAGGNDRVILCERGIRSFDTATRFTLDLNAVPLVRQLSHLPIIVDPSHGTGRRELVEPMALAGIAAGAHGVIIESVPDPENAMCDGPQSITPEMLRDIAARMNAISMALQPESALSI